MRANIEAHHQPDIQALMVQLGTTNPSVAVNFIVSLWRTGPTVPPPSKPSPASPSPAAAPAQDKKGSVSVELIDF
jgi:hypothetical protein